MSPLTQATRFHFELKICQQTINLLFEILQKKIPTKTKLSVIIQPNSKGFLQDIVNALISLIFELIYIPVVTNE